MTTLTPGTQAQSRTTERAGSDAALIHQIIDGRQVRSVFQPLVHLEDGDVAGYEALSRGPLGTALESPLALLDAAAAVGRLAELDWVCRASGIRAALAADLHPAQTLFVNVEPASLGVPCPADLEPVFSAVSERFRIITEFTERALLIDPASLLTAVSDVRDQGWGVALDDVGALPGSLALLPFLHPDVIKLDMRLVAGQVDAEIAAIANAVRAHSEATGAVILAEGIETEAQVLLALTLGATYGQGWLYGRPSPLPAVTVGPKLRFPRLSSPAAVEVATPFEIVSGARSAQRTEKALLQPMSRHLEAQALVDGPPSVLLGCFQHARHFTPATRRRFSALSSRTAFTAAIGEGLELEPVPGVRGAHLGSTDRLRGEWNVIVVGPHFAAALVALDLGDTGPDDQRRFDYVITHDRELVLRAARSLMHWVTPAA